MSRDHRADFQAYIEKHWPTGDYVRSVLAAEFVADLRISDPELLAGWLDVNAEQLVTQFIGDRDRARRARSVSETPQRVFKEAADQFAAGDSTALSAFAATLVVNAENLSRPVGQMTKADHLFVASRHVERSNAELFEAAFHKAVAKKIPAGKTTSDVMTEAEYLRLRDSIRKPKGQAA